MSSQTTRPEGRPSPAFLIDACRWSRAALGPNRTKLFMRWLLSVIENFVPDVIPAEACYLGWQESLTLLAKLVEAEIPDQP